MEEAELVFRIYSANAFIIIMLREKKRPAVQNSQLDEAVRIEHLMAAGWPEKEIAEGLEREGKYVESVVRRRRGISFGRRRAEVMQEVLDASKKAGRSIGLLMFSKVDGEPMQDGGPMQGVGKLGRGDEDAKAARLERIGRLMAVGFGIRPLAKALDMSESGLKQFIYDTGNTFRDMERNMALEVTMASVRAGRSTKKIAKQLGITERTLLYRLGGVGISLGGIRKEVRQESIANAGERVEKYLSKALEKIPDGAPARWQASGATKKLGLYQQVFLHLVRGKTKKSFGDENGFPGMDVSGVASAVLPDVRHRRREIARRVYELIQVPGVSQNERKVFEFIAVRGMTNEQAIEEFGRNVDVTKTKRILLRKIPELAPLLRYGKAAEQE